MKYLVAFVLSWVGYIVLNFVVSSYVLKNGFDLQYAITSGFAVAVVSVIAYRIFNNKEEK